MEDLFATPQSSCRKEKICRSITLTAGAILKDHRKPSFLWWRDKLETHLLLETMWARVIASQKLPRDSGESIFTAGYVDLRTPRPATEPRSGPTWNFHEKYRKNTPRAEILEPQENTPKIAKKYQKYAFWYWYFRGVFSVFSGYFGGKFWDSRISGQGVFFRYFSWKFRVGPFRGSVAGRGVLKCRCLAGPSGKGVVLLKGECFCLLESPLSQRAPGLKKFNLERQHWKNQAFNTEWNFQSRMVFSFRAPLWPQKNKARDWNFQSRMKISNWEWKFQARMKISCVGEWFFSCVRARMNFLDPGALWV